MLKKILIILIRIVLFVVAFNIFMMLSLINASHVRTHTHITERFKPSQINQICEAFKFELNSGETILTEYRIGGRDELKKFNVHIKNIESETDFRSRIYKDIEESGTWRSINLSFHRHDGNLCATFNTTGQIREFRHIYDFVYNPNILPPMDAIYVAHVIVLLLCITYSIIKPTISLIIKRRKL